MTNASLRVDRFLFLCLCAGLFFLPLVRAARSWHWMYILVVAFALAAAHLFNQALHRRPKSAFGSEKSLLVLCLVALGYLLLKSLPIWPEPVIAILSPNILATYESAGVNGWNGIGTYALSIDAWLSARDFLRVLAWFTVMVLVVELVNSPKRAQVLLWCLLGSVFSAALLGLFDFFSIQGARGRASGPFGTNANMFAGLIELGVGLAIGVLYVQQQSANRAPTTRWVAFVAENLLSGKVLVVALLLLFFAVLSSTGSRGGNLSAMLALATASMLLVRSRASIGSEKVFLIVLWPLCILGVFALGGSIVLDRVGVQGSELVRVSFWRSAIEMTADYPLFGMGGGSWRYAYAQYREISEVPALEIPLTAHNDYVQMLAEHGVLGLLVFGVFIGMVLRSIIKTLQYHRDPIARGISLGTLISALSLLFHAAVDGNFQVTATMTLYFAILGLGLAASRLPPANAEEGAPRACK